MTPDHWQPSTRERFDAVAVANEQVSIIAVCALLGLRVDTDTQRAVKVRCPFGDLYHSDGGAQAAFRVYPHSNHAFCFAGCGSFTPTRLWAHARDLSLREAASDLLHRYGIRAPSLAHRWSEALSWSAPPARGELAEALKTYCRRVGRDFTDRQFETPVAVVLTRCLGLLEHVRTEADAERWLGVCKGVMRRTLDTRKVDDCTDRDLP